MLYDLDDELQRGQFNAKAGDCLDKRRVVELIVKTFRSGRQNSYMHLIIGAVALETGNTLDYCKEWYFKRLCNKDLFLIRKEDKYVGVVEDLRSSADLSVEEMSMAIDRFKKWAAENGMFLPEPGDKALLRKIEIEMGRNKAYLGG